MKQLKNSKKRSSNKKQKEISDLATPEIYLQLELVHPLPLSRNMPNQSHIAPGREASGLLIFG